MKRKITDKSVYKVLIRKRNFETSVAIFLDSDSTKVLPSVKENLKHENMYIPIASDVYFNVLKYKLNRVIDFRKAGCIIQPFLPWLVASLTGVVNDHSNGHNHIGLVEIICPKAKQNNDYDKSLYSEKVDGHLKLKKRTLVWIL